jgi:hypothetical protein
MQAKEVLLRLTKKVGHLMTEPDWAKTDIQKLDAPHTPIVKFSNVWRKPFDQVEENKLLFYLTKGLASTID